MLQFKDDQISGPSSAFIISKNCNGSQKNIISRFFFSSGFSLQIVTRMPFKSTCAGPCSQRSGEFHCLQNPHGTLSSPGETGSWGLLHKRSLWSSGCCQEARQRGIKHPQSLS